jgi:type I restriction enzyme S subunit
MGEWKEATLGDAIELQRGYDLTESQRLPGNVPVIGSAGINGRHATHRAKGPGLTIGRSGASFGNVTYTREDYWPHNTVLFAVNFRGNDPYWAACAISQIDFDRFNSGSAQPSLNRNYLYTIPLRIPPLLVQRRVGAVLAAYDELIENNTRRIRVLEEMARVFWSQWKSSVSSSAPVGSLVRLVRDQVDPSSVDPETPYIGLEHIPRRSLDLSERGKASDAISAKTAFARWDIIFGKIRPYFHKVGPSAFDGISSNDAVVMRVRQEEDFSAVLMCVTSDEFVAEISQKANGSKMPRADWGDMAAYQAPCGSPEDRSALNRAVRPMVEMIQNLGERNRALRAARDLLLPKLLSGELSVDRIPDPAEAAP